MTSGYKARVPENKDTSLQARAQTAAIVHELNTLLTVIVGNAEFLTEKLETRHDLRQLARDIATAGDRSAELTRRLVVAG